MVATAYPVDRVRLPEMGHKTGSRPWCEHILNFFGATRIFCGKCCTPFERGERARHFELLFVAFYRREVCPCEEERSKKAPGGRMP